MIGGPIETAKLTGRKKSDVLGHIRLEYVNTNVSSKKRIHGELTELNCIFDSNLFTLSFDFRSGVSNRNSSSCKIMLLAILRDS